MTSNAKGWECPRCRVVHAPWMPKCSCTPGTVYLTTMTPTTVDYCSPECERAGCCQRTACPVGRAL